MDLAIIACIAAALAAAVHGCIFVLETPRWEEPGTRRGLGTSEEQAAETVVELGLDTDERCFGRRLFQPVPIA